MSAPTASRHHADWLSLVEISGPFVSLPVLLRVFSQGLEPRDPTQAKALRAAYDEWQDNPAAPGQQRAWVLYILTAVLGYPSNQLVEGQTLPSGLEVSMLEMGETLRPDLALIGPAGTDTSGNAQLLIAIYPAEQKLDRPVIGKHWKATPATRMMELLHGADVPLGLVTNGEQWMLVYAPRGEITGYSSWFGALWLDEPITLRAFHSLLGVRRFFGVADDSTLLALLKESANDQQEVTDQLGFQVREAVEVLVQSFESIDKDSNRVLLKGVSPTAQYEAALTIMMRLVFLFSAEERGLLHLGKPLYDNNYAVSTLQEQLQEVADLYGEEVLERRTDAWARLLSSFRAVHGGVKHQDLLMQAYGGSLFDPDRYPFLEGRMTGSLWRHAAAQPLEVNNRVVLHLLNSLQRLRTKIGSGGVMENRRISFRALGVEQIGHVYEGLLDHTAVRATEPVLGIKGANTSNARISLSSLESFLEQGQESLINFLKNETGRSLSALRKALVEISHQDEHKLLIACDQDEILVSRLRPFVGLIGEDSFGRPLVVLSGGVYVTNGTTRRSTGTHYTPPTLTEPIVQHTLEPLIYQGPASGWPREQWKLKSPKDILDLKVCDMAMGSGAFLVQVCRYLADRLVEAWENEEKLHPGQVLITPDGKFSEGSPIERLVPTDVAERIAIARRAVADRCLYGVDINPMAVEMAKLSLWLITVDSNRPFTFLDHAFKCGDSLLGITAMEQLTNFSLHSESSKQQNFSNLNLLKQVEIAKEKRLALEVMPSDTPDQIFAKAELYLQSEEAVARLTAAADLLIAFELKNLKGTTYKQQREVLSDQLTQIWWSDIEEIKSLAREKIGSRRCMHWSLTFPEVMSNGGFSALIGNPPFIGGKKFSEFLGEDYKKYLVKILANERRGSADLSAYFVLRANELTTPGGYFGLIATGTICQGDTREVGLDQILNSKSVVYRANPSVPWPGQANLDVSLFWICKGAWAGDFFHNEVPVNSLTSFLSPAGKVDGKPFRLKENSGKSFQGTIVYGTGFIVEADVANKLLTIDVKNRDCLQPYLNGDDLNSQINLFPSRWIINFKDWPLNRSDDSDWFSLTQEAQVKLKKSGFVSKNYPYPVAEDYPDLISIVKKEVKSMRDAVVAKGKQIHEYCYWRFWDRRDKLYSSIEGEVRVLVKGQVSSSWAFAHVENGFIYDQKLVVFSNIPFIVMQSSIHHAWVLKYASTIGATGLNYTPTDCCETFPFPLELSDSHQQLGKDYEEFRSELMKSLGIGLTKIGNRFNDPVDQNENINKLRSLHKEIDYTVIHLYGWTDLNLDHGFHETRQGIRYTISEAARSEVLDRLLSLNHQRKAAEEDIDTRSVKNSTTKRGSKSKESVGQITLNL